MVKTYTCTASSIERAASQLANHINEEQGREILAVSHAYRLTSSDKGAPMERTIHNSEVTLIAVYKQH